VFYRYDTHEIDHAELPTASFRPLDWNSKAEAEKKRVIEAVQNAINNFDSSYVSDELLSFLFDAGFLRMPAE